MDGLRNETTLRSQAVTVTDYIIENLSVGDLRFVVRHLISSGITAIEGKDLSELRNSLQLAFVLAEASNILWRQFQVAQTHPMSEADVERFHKYIEQREQAVKAIEEFHQIKGLFASHYAGRYVAFYRGEVVDSDTDRRALAKRFYEKYGNVPVCITKVSEERETIRIVTPFFHRG